MSTNIASYISLSTPTFLQQGMQEFGIPVSNIKPLVKLLVTQGVPLDALLKDTGITLKDFTLFNHTVIFAQYRKLLLNARALSQDTAYALKLGEQFFINHDGVLACRVMSSDTPDQAMALLEVYQSLFTQLLHFQYESDEKGGIFTVEEKLPLGDTLPHFIEYTFSALFCLGRFCTGQSHIDLEIELSYPCPGDPEVFEHFFQNPVRFNCKQNRVFFPAHTLQRSIIFADTLAAAENETLCQQHFHQVQSDEILIKKVKQTIRKTPFTQVSLEQLGDKLHMSPRSLRRHLHAQGVNYKTLLENERKRLALKRIESSEHSLDDIAHELGYHNASSFSRAFKRWFGQSPLHYKQMSHSESSQ
ncbi:MAG: AraC family transcriptional regulator ligand-binding domain-containing protein [Gammaproteobacteria bacterium]|nr:AraC family transcriptional regulator ligand-binding domain-containing protein [Gammaproteobacteria bacterium]